LEESPLLDSDEPLQPIPAASSLTPEEQSMVMSQHPTSQNKNSVKYAARLFMKYFRKLSVTQDLEAWHEINDAFMSCQSEQEKITLEFYQRVFRDSARFGPANRRTLHRVLGSFAVLNKELFHNGNVKLKLEYLCACKLLRLRSRCGALCVRAQTR
jgi:hypothetical protein